MKGEIMIYTVKRIEEDVDYGCEERPEDVPCLLYTSYWSVQVRW